MMTRIAILAFLFVTAVCAQPYKGLGASTTTCLDKDGDTYGVGPGCTARDADDDDPAVHTAAEAVSKWGTMQAFLAHRGYAPLRYWVMSPTGTDNASCVSHTFAADPDPTAVAACATHAYFRASIQAGDMVLYRGGNYAEKQNIYLSVTGTSIKPTIYLGYPGETATITHDTDFNACAAGFTPQNRDYIVIDGFVLDGNPATGSEAVNLCYNDHFTIRYNEAKNHGRGFFGSFMTNVLVEYNVSHDTNAGGNPSHTLYFGARETPLDGAVIRYNIFWNPGRTCLQLNGRFNNPVIDGNWCYGYDSTAGISLEMGVNGAQVRNNVVWNGQTKPFIIYNYPNQTACGTPTIQPYNMQNNVVENNVFVVPQKNLNGTTFAGAPNIEIADDTDYGETYSFSGTVFRNNILPNYSGYQPVSIHTTSQDCSGSYRGNGYVNPSTIASGITWQNNIVPNVSSGGTMMWTYNTPSSIIGTPPGSPASINLQYTFAEWQAYNGTTTANVNADPLFTAYNHAWYATPGNFDFRPQVASPAINAGSTLTSATLDVIGHGRTVTPSIGAYQYAPGGTAIPLNTWVSVAARSATHGANGWDKMFYARSAKKGMLYGHYQEGSTEENNALGAFDFESKRWDILDVSSLFAGRGMPESGHNQAMAYNPATGTVLWHCCGAGSNQFENRWSTVEYDPVGQVGRNKHQITRPNMYSNYQEQSTFDITAGKFLVFNGTLYAYDSTTDAWSTRTSPTCTVACPPLITNGSLDFNTSNSKSYLFGGNVAGTKTNEVYTYHYATNTWTRLAPSGTKPVGRQKAGWAYDSTNDVFIMYGGETGDISGFLNDTWMFDPNANSGQGSWIQLTPAGNPTTPSSSPHERMYYDPDHNVVMLYQNDSAVTSYVSGANACCTLRAWAFRYGGNGPGMGMLNVTGAPTAGTLNEQATGWAKEPVIAVNGSTLTMAWSEMDRPDTAGTASRWAHLFAKQYTSSLTDVGGVYNSIGQENGGSVEMHLPSLAYVNGTPWLSYSTAAPPSASWNPAIYVRSGSSWTGGAIGLRNNVAGVYQSRSSMSSIGTTPYVAFMEVDKSAGLLLQQSFVFLKSWNGSSWVNQGTALNRDGGVCNGASVTCTIASSVAATTNGSTLYVAWTEHLSNNFTTDTAPKVYVSTWNGSTLTTLGGALNNSTSCFASDVAITFMSGQPYVAWTERCQGASQQLYVKTTADGTTWTAVGAGSLNWFGVGGWSMNPSITNNGTALFLGWTEQQGVGKKAQAVLAKYSAGSWSALGSGLNMDPSGSAQSASVAVLSGQPVVIWGEVKPAAYRNIYIKQWDGSQWAALGSAITPGASMRLGSGIIRSGTFR